MNLDYEVDLRQALYDDQRESLFRQVEADRTAQATRQWRMSLASLNARRRPR